MNQENLLLDADGNVKLVDFGLVGICRQSSAVNSDILSCVSSSPSKNATDLPTASAAPTSAPIAALSISNDMNDPANDLAVRSTPSFLLKTQCGSDFYSAPEVLRGEAYDGFAADIWSLGIVLYAMLCGCLPFEDPDVQVLHALINDGLYEIPTWLSGSSENIINACLRHDPHQRLTADQLLHHPWLREDLGVENYEDIPVKNWLHDVRVGAWCVAQ